MAMRHWQYINPEEIDERPDSEFDLYYFEEGWEWGLDDVPTFTRLLQDEAVKCGYLAFHSIGFNPHEGAYVVLKKKPKTEREP